MPFVSFYSPWKHQKTSVFRVIEKKPVTWNRLRNSDSLWPTQTHLVNFSREIQQKYFKAKYFQCCITQKQQQRETFVSMTYWSPYGRNIFPEKNVLIDYVVFLDFNGAFLISEITCGQNTSKSDSIYRLLK